MKKSNGRIGLFLRRNALYLILAMCILAIGLSMTLVVVNRDTNPTISQNRPNDQTGEENKKPSDQNNNENSGPVSKPDETPSEPVVSVVTFVMPVNTNDYSEYSETMVFNSTLGRFSAHKAMDFFAEEGAEVFAVYGGTVESVESTLLEGVTVVINHGNGLKTIYNSLADGDVVSVGQTVKQGDVIGNVSVSNRQEHKEGAHLHFEVEEDGLIINPTVYLDLSEK